MTKLLGSLVVGVAIALAACGPKATPVTPQPLSVEEQGKLGEALRGTWNSTHIKVGDDGSKKAETSFHFTFHPDGRLETLITTMFNVANKWTYSLDGKNVKTNSIFGTLRVDAVTPTSIELFSYDSTTTYYCTRQ